jgi:hypothetical protein
LEGKKGLLGFVYLCCAEVSSADWSVKPAFLSDRLLSTNRSTDVRLVNYKDTFAAVAMRCAMHTSPNVELFPIPTCPGGPD